MQAQMTRSMRQAAPASPRRIARPAASARSIVANVQSRFGGGRGGVLDKPDVDVAKTSGWDSGKDLAVATPAPKTESGSGGTSRLPGSGGGAWRVLLMDSEKHSEGAVVKAITAVVPNTDVNHAKNCFQTSKQLGLAIITTCMKEHAEFYRNQLYHYGCKTTIEPDLTVA